MEIDIPNLDDVEFVSPYCHSCYGRGKIPQYNKGQRIDDATCYKCDGAGRYLTGPGKKLMEFLTSIGVHIMNPDGWKKKDE